MAIINPNMEDVVEVQPGTYQVRITSSEEKQSRNPGKDGKRHYYVEWGLEIFGAEDERVNGRPLKLRTMITGAGAGMFGKFFLDVTGNKWPDEGISDFDTMDLHGSTLTVVVDWATDKNGNQTTFPEVQSHAPAQAA